VSLVTGARRLSAKGGGEGRAPGISAGADDEGRAYISSSSYIFRMSDFKRGPWCEIWDGLFWRFIDRPDCFSARIRDWASWYEI
jgi:hypothetical protein